MLQVCQIDIKIIQALGSSRESLSRNSLLFFFTYHGGKQLNLRGIFRTLSCIYDGTFYKNRSSPPEVFLRKSVLKTCSKFTGEHRCRSGVSIMLQYNFIEITLRHWCSPVNLLDILEHLFVRTPLDSCFFKNI